MCIFHRLRKRVKAVHTKSLIRTVEKTLGIKFTGWQIDYIFNNYAYMPAARRCGKTLAHIVKISLSKGETIDLRSRNVAAAFSDYEVDAVHYRVWYRNEFISIYKKLKTNKKIKLRKIILPSGMIL